MAYVYVSGETALSAALSPCAPSKVGRDWLVRFDCTVNMADAWQASVFSIGEMARITADGWGSAKSPDRKIAAAQADLVKQVRSFADLLKSTSKQWRKVIQNGREHVALLRQNELDATRYGVADMLVKIENQKQAAFLDAAVPIADHSLLHMTIADRFRSLLVEMSAEIARSDAENLRRRMIAIKGWEKALKDSDGFLAWLYRFFKTLSEASPFIVYGIVAYFVWKGYKMVTGKGKK